MELKINEVNAQEMQMFIKKLLSIDKFIFMKLSDKGVVSSVYLPQRDAVKLVNVKTSDVFGKDVSVEDPIKISFFNGNKVNEALSHFVDDCHASIVYSKIGDENIASDFVLENENLKIKLFCSDPSLNFMEMSEEEIRRAFSAANVLFEFELLTTHVDRMKSLFKLEDDKETFKLRGSSKGISVVGEAYDAVLTHNVEKLKDDNAEVTIYKKYLPLLDKENYRVSVCQNKVVFKSLDTNTLLTIAVAIVDDDE